MSSYCPHTDICVLFVILCARRTTLAPPQSPYHSISVLILLCMCPHTTYMCICVHDVPYAPLRSRHTTIYVSSYYYVRVFILLYASLYYYMCVVACVYSCVRMIRIRLSGRMRTHTSLWTYADKSAREVLVGL